MKNLCILLKHKWFGEQVNVLCRMIFTYIMNLLCNINVFPIKFVLHYCNLLFIHWWKYIRIPANRWIFQSVIVTTCPAEIISEYFSAEKKTTVHWLKNIAKLNINSLHPKYQRWPGSKYQNKIEILGTVEDWCFKQTIGKGWVVMVVTDWSKPQQGGIHITQETVISAIC